MGEGSVEGTKWQYLRVSKSKVGRVVYEAQDAVGGGRGRVLQTRARNKRWRRQLLETGRGPNAIGDEEAQNPI